MARLSKREQDAIVMELTDVDGGADPDDPEWQSEFDRLDPEHQMEVDAAIREFADNAVGNPNWDSVPRSFARFNRKYANPVIRQFAGSFGPLTLVTHHGRRTGRVFATPVMSFATDDGLVIAVVYGPSSDWVKNVLASPRVEVKRRGQSRQYESARLVERDEGLHLVPAIVRGTFRTLGVRHFVRLTECRTS